jgi:hypothetical protein
MGNDWIVLGWSPTINASSLTASGTLSSQIHNLQSIHKQRMIISKPQPLLRGIACPDLFHAAHCLDLSALALISGAEPDVKPEGEDGHADRHGEIEASGFLEARCIGEDPR